VEGDAVTERTLAAWYRHSAACAGNLVICLARLTTAEKLEREAARLEERADPAWRAQRTA